MATTFKIKLSKSGDQQTITIKQNDSVDLSAVSAIVANIYTDDLVTADSSHTFTAGELSSFLTDGEVDISTTTLLGASPSDDLYAVQLNGDTGDYLSDLGGIAITLEAAGKVYSKQGFVAVYSDDFRTAKVRHVAHMLYMEMNTLEWQSVSLQKRIDFTTRLAHLQKILNYS